MSEPRLFMSDKGRAELRENATGALHETGSVTSMLLCGQIITMLDDIDTLLARVKELEADDE
jgi:hypothetical protein